MWTRACASTSPKFADICHPFQAYFYCIKKRSKPGDNGETNKYLDRTRAKTKKMNEVYTTVKILLAGLQIISTAGFNLGVDFPPMVRSKKTLAKSSGPKTLAKSSGPRVFCTAKILSKVPKLVHFNITQSTAFDSNVRSLSGHETDGSSEYREL